MGEYVRDLNGKVSPHVIKYSIAASFANAGVLVEAPNAGDSGVTPNTTTTAADVVGISLDTATYSTTQTASGTQAYVSTVVNAQGEWRFLMSGGATEGTALTQYTVTTASATGVSVITATDWTCPQFDEGVVWAYSGANVAQWRKITATGSTAASLTVPFDVAIAVGDVFLRAPYFAPMDTTAKTVQFTTNLYQADASIAVGTGCTCAAVELELYDLAGNGRTTSAVYIMSLDNVFNLPSTI